MDDFYQQDKRIIFMSEIPMMFSAFNRPCSIATGKAKCELLMDTLHSIPLDKIRLFFRYVRDNEAVLPSDSRLLALLRLKQDVFGPEKSKMISHQKHKWGEVEKIHAHNTAMKYPAFIPLFEELLKDEDIYPTKEWNTRFWEAMQKPASFKESSFWTPEKEAILMARKERV